MLDLSWKSVIVAGGSGLIGKAVCSALESRRWPANVENIDLADGKDIAGLEMLKELCLESRLPDIFINCAYPTNLLSHTLVNYLPLARLGEAMQKRGHGVIVMMSSIYGIVGPQPEMYDGTGIPLHESWYAFAKAGIIGAVRDAACRYAPVRVNAVAPGGVFNGQDERFIKAYSSRCPLGRMVTAEEVAHAVVFLLENEAMTGAVIPVDGGWTCR